METVEELAMKRQMEIKGKEITARGSREGKDKKRQTK